MKYLMILSLYLFSLTVSAQDCDKEALKTIPGKWLPQPASTVASKLSAAEIDGAKKVLDQIQQLFQKQFKPVGMDTYHAHHYMDNEYIDKKSNYGNYSIYTIRSFLFYCSKGKKETSSEGVGSYVHINPGGIFGKYFSEVPLNDEYGKLNSELHHGGFYGFESNELTDAKLPDFSNGYYIQQTFSDYKVWITYEGKQPFRYVTRREFLEKQVAIAEAQMKEQQQTYSSKEFKDMLAMMPQQNKEKVLDEMKKGQSVLYERPLEAYKEDLKKDAAWLNQMAVVESVSIRDPKTNAHLYSRYGFTELNNPNRSFFVPIMPNPSYYNRSLPKWAPQFITINVPGPGSFMTKDVQRIVANNIEFFKSLLVRQ